VLPVASVRQRSLMSLALLPRPSGWVEALGLPWSVRGKMVPVEAARSPGLAFDASSLCSMKGRVRGELVTDAVIVALCREHGVDTVLTHDRDFDRLSDIRVARLGC
jgi:hypothetical protein